MDVVIVYESVFGNTRVIAEAVADGMRQVDPEGRVAVLDVVEAAPDKLADAALVVVGRPTHMRGMSKASSRRTALLVDQDAAAGAGDHTEAGSGADGPGVRDWLEALPKTPRGRMAAAFDTRLPFPLAGGAGPSIARRLRRRGYDVVVKSEGFVVDAAQGPLQTAERERAKAWGARLVRLAGQPVRGPVSFPR